MYEKEETQTSNSSQELQKNTSYDEIGFIMPISWIKPSMG